MGGRGGGAGEHDGDQPRGVGLEGTGIGGSVRRRAGERCQHEEESQFRFHVRPDLQAVQRSVHLRSHFVRLQIQPHFRRLLRSPAMRYPAPSAASRSLRGIHSCQPCVHPLLSLHDSHTGHHRN